MAKRISTSSVNWTSLWERVPAEQRSSLNAFKIKSDGYLRRVMANPATPPKIDWALYKRVVPVAGMVDKFQKQYEALSIPYPSDTQTSQVEAQWSEVKKAIEAYVKESNNNITSLQQEVATISALLPYDQMTLEDFKDAHPEDALDPLNKPTFWPHNPEEQPGYVDPNAPPEHH